VTDEQAAICARVGRALTAAVEASHLPRTAIAKQAGVGRSIFYRAMKGEVMVSVIVLASLAKVLGIQVGPLIEGRVEADPNAPPPADLSATVLADDLRSLKNRAAHFVTRKELDDLRARVVKLGELVAEVGANLEALRAGAQQSPAPRGRSGVPVAQRREKAE
jgi:transcriptional regulator with XRE-family HTH domain